MSFSDTNGIRIGYAPTVSEAISQIWPGAGSAATVTQPAPDPDTGAQPETPTTPTAPAPPASSDDVTKALAEVNSAMAALKSAQQSGDFTSYGAALDRLQKAVDAYQALPR